MSNRTNYILLDHRICSVSGRQLGHSWFGHSVSTSVAAAVGCMHLEPIHMQLQSPHRHNRLSAGASVVGVSAGAEHSAAVTASGEVYTWGSGDNGRCGHQAQRLWGADTQTPRLLRAFGGARIAAVAAGHMHTGDWQSG
jgi:alpha-tubulin suppressor-like RCC1 family protein